MSGFLQRLVERVQGPAHAALRRRRPSVFEAREAAPTLPMVLDAERASPAPTPAGGGERVLVHSHDIHHLDRTDTPVTLRARRAERPARPASAGTQPLQAALPAPPSLHPVPVSSAAPAMRRGMAAVVASVEAPPLSVRRPRRAAETTAPAPPAPRMQQTAEAAEPAPLRRARPAAAASSPSPPSVPALPLPPRLPATRRAAAPVAHPARRAALPAAAETPVHVTIGSVEIRANPPGPGPAPQRPPSRPVAGAVVPSLDAYLRQRHGGPR